MSLARELTEHYGRTTALRDGGRDRAFFERSADGLERRLRPWLPARRDAAIVDLACGCGELVYLLERRGHTNVRGVDLCTEELEAGRALVRSPLLHGDVVDFVEAEPPASLDLVTALNLAEHLPKDRLLAFFRGVARVLRPGGHLVLMVPNALSPFGGMTRHWDLTHEWAFTPNNFRQLAPLCGFDGRVELRECAPEPHGPKSALRWAAWQGLRAGIAAWLLVEVADTRGGVYTADMLVRLSRSGE